MVLSIFGRGSGPELRPMERKDLATVLKIIAQHDEDDFEEARDELREDFDGMFVLVDGGKIVGVTGGAPDPHSDDVAWLSWTYVDAERQGEGLGRKLFESICDVLRLSGVRKLFINTSDYREDTYAIARAFYEKMGASHEVTLPDYHAVGEARLTYGLTLGKAVNGPEPAAGALRFINIEELDESDGGMGLVWEEVEDAAEPATIDPNLDQWIRAAREQGARVLFAAVPSDLCANLNGPLGAAGLEHHGRLLDYFAPGIHQELGSLKF